MKYTIYNAILLSSLSVIPSAAFVFRSRNFQKSSAGSVSLSAEKKTLEAILFDCDGVLAETERDGHRQSFNRAFEMKGLEDEWSVERYGKLLEIGGGKERMTGHWNEVGWPDQMEKDSDDARQEKVKELHLLKTDLFMKLIDEKVIPLRSGVLRLVDEAIASGVRLAVCSTSNEKAVQNIVTTLMSEEQAKEFLVFAGDMVKAKKPAPDVYNMACEKMGLDKSRCVVIEDSHIGLSAAKAAGLACLVTKSSYTGGEDFTAADMVVDELGDDANTGVTLETLTDFIN